MLLKSSLGKKTRTTASTAEIHEVLILLFYLGNTLEKKKEPYVFCYNFKMLKSPPYLKLSQLRDKRLLLLFWIIYS